MQFTPAESNSNPGYIDVNNLEGLAKSWQFYSGEFQNNLMHGHGTLLLSNNEKFIGQFENGKVQGEGAYYAANGDVLTAIWENSRLVSSVNLVKASCSPSNNVSSRY